LTIHPGGIEILIEKRGAFQSGRLFIGLATENMTGLRFSSAFMYHNAMGIDSVVVQCAGCSALLEEPINTPVDERLPCESCGSKGRLVAMVRSESVDIHSNLLLKGKHPDRQAFY